MGNSKSVIFLTLFAIFYLTSTASSKSIFAINEDLEVEKILHGTDVDISSYPYTALIQSGNMQCNGAIIGPYTVLTAAHCISDFDTMVVYTGITGLFSKNRVARSVQFIDFVRGWSSFSIFGIMFSGYDNDLAVITLSEKIEFNQYQNSIELIKRPVKPNEEGYLSSWGITEYGTLSNVLRKGNFRILSGFGTGYEDKFHARSVNNVGPCQGDSGGPLVVNGSLAGILSIIVGQPIGIFRLFYDRCSNNYPAGFTNIYHHAPEIMDIVERRLKENIRDDNKY